MEPAFSSQTELCAPGTHPNLLAVGARFVREPHWRRFTASGPSRTGIRMLRSSRRTEILAKFGRCREGFGQCPLAASRRGLAIGKIHSPLGRRSGLCGRTVLGENRREIRGTSAGGISRGFEGRAPLPCPI